MLRDYFPNEVNEIFVELDESQGKEPMIEICRVITINDEGTQEDNDNNEDELKVYYLIEVTLYLSWKTIYKQEAKEMRAFKERGEEGKREITRPFNTNS